MSNITSTGGSSVYVRQSGLNIQRSYDQSSWSTVTFPVTVTNSSPGDGFLTVVFTTDISITSSSQYFLCNSSKIQFGLYTVNSNGSRPTINITTNNYDGLISNGESGMNGQNDILIFNLNISASGYITQIGAGWIGKQYFGRGAARNYIVNCSSDGDIANTGGGIVGQYAGSSSNASLIIIGCSTTGIINSEAGGIAGSNAGESGGRLYCRKCFSSGTINSDGGGIVGNGQNIGTLFVSSCYSTGLIQANGGGICGSHFAESSGSASIIACYSNGDISSGAGGIVGGSAGSVTISNCYTTGKVIGSNGGCISGNTSRSITVTNCYTVGEVYNGTGYIIGGSSTVPVTCYSEANTGTQNTWTNANANTALTGVASPNIGSTTTWVNDSSGQPYKLLRSGSQVYSVTKIFKSTVPTAVASFSEYLLENNYSVSILAGETSGNALPINAYSNIVIQTSGDNTITVNQGTGVISTTYTTTPGTYTIYVIHYYGNNYNISIVTLTVSDNPNPILPVSPDTNPTISVNTSTYMMSDKKKGVFANQGSLSRTERIRNDAINKVRNSYDANYYHKNTTEKNTVNNAICRVRGGGAVAPPIKNANRTFNLSLSFSAGALLRSSHRAPVYTQPKTAMFGKTVNAGVIPHSH
jgi:hypothetical protein